MEFQVGSKVVYDNEYTGVIVSFEDFAEPDYGNIKLAVVKLDGPATGCVPPVKPDRTICVSVLALTEAR